MFQYSKYLDVPIWKRYQIPGTNARRTRLWLAVRQMTRNFASHAPKTRGMELWETVLFQNLKLVCKWQLCSIFIICRPYDTDNIVILHSMKFLRFLFKYFSSFFEAGRFMPAISSNIVLTIYCMLFLSVVAASKTQTDVSSSTVSNGIAKQLIY